MIAPPVGKAPEAPERGHPSKVAEDDRRQLRLDTAAGGDTRVPGELSSIPIGFEGGSAHDLALPALPPSSAT